MSGGLGLLGAEVCEALLVRGEVEVYCHDRLDEEEEDVVNYVPLEEKRASLERLSRWAGSGFHFVAEKSLAGAVSNVRPTELALLGLCGPSTGGYRQCLDALRASPCVRSAIVASSAAVYDLSTEGARRGGSSERTHKRPLLSESDAGPRVEPPDAQLLTLAETTRQVERAAQDACEEDRQLSVGILRYFGIFGGSRWARRLGESGGVATAAANKHGLPSVGAYGCSDFCGLTDAAEAALRSLDFFRRTAEGGRHTCVAINVGSGRAHRPEHVDRAVARAAARRQVVGSGGDYNNRTPAAAEDQNILGDGARAGFAAADVSKLRALLGWVPNASLDAAVARELENAIAKGAAAILADAAETAAAASESAPETTTASDAARRAFTPPTQGPSTPPSSPRPRGHSSTSPRQVSSNNSRSLAALDLSSCTQTNLLQVSTYTSLHETEKHKNQRFFQLNQRTVIVPYTRNDQASSNDKPNQPTKRPLAEVFAAV